MRLKTALQSFLGILLIAHPVISDSCSGNTAADRSVWCDYDLSTDYYEVVPETGVTREYWFEINQTTAAPDGYSRMVMAINGSVPGPTIYADWGDIVKIHVSRVSIWADHVALTLC